MANDLKFVDSVAVSPTTLLDLNDRAVGGFWLDEFSAPPPSLRRSLSDALLTDGQRMSSSAYDNRSITAAFRLMGTADQTSLAIQNLGRAIDSPLSLLRWQPQGQTKPVFFRVLRSPLNGVDESLQHLAQDTRRVEVELLAEPAAYGLPVDIASFTITNDPTAGTNKMMVGPSVLGTIQGDLETPLLVAQTNGLGVASTSPDDAAQPDAPAYLASYALRGGLTHSFLARDLTELTSGTDVGATVSAAGTSYVGGNYKQWTPAAATMLTRLSGSFSTAFTPMPGTYRVLVRIVLPSGATAARDITMQLGVSPTAGGNYVYGDPVTVHLLQQTGINAGTLIDLGLVQFPVGVDVGAIGLAPASTAAIAPDISIQASVSSTGLNVRFDEIYFIPADTNYGDGRIALIDIPLVGSHNALVFDGIGNAMRPVFDSGPGPFVGTPTPLTNGGYRGGLPTVQPGANNYLQFLFEDNPVGGTTSFVGRYYPRYLYSRPAST